MTKQEFLRKEEIMREEEWLQNKGKEEFGKNVMHKMPNEIYCCWVERWMYRIVKS